MNTDEHWEQYGKTNPYYAVLTADKYKGDIAAQPELIEEFFQTGRDHIALVLDIISSSVCQGFTPANALDFGCGVARLLVPLAERGLAVTGVDISESMLDISRKNLTSRHLPVAALSQSLDDLPQENRYDFVHSYIVLQHIPVGKGLVIIDQLLGRVSDTGVAVFHIPYTSSESHPPYANILKGVVLRFKILSSLFRLVRGRDINPPMLMENYPLDTVFSALHSGGFNNVHVRHTQHGPHRGMVIFAQRSQTIPHPAPL